MKGKETMSKKVFMQRYMIRHAHDCNGYYKPTLALSEAEEAWGLLQLKNYGAGDELK